MWAWGRISCPKPLLSKDHEGSKGHEARERRACAARVGPCQGRYRSPVGSYTCPFEAPRALTSDAPLESRGGRGNARVMNSGALRAHQPPRAGHYGRPLALGPVLQTSLAGVLGLTEPRPTVLKPPRKPTSRCNLPPKPPPSKSPLRLYCANWIATEISTYAQLDMRNVTADIGTLSKEHIRTERRR